MGEEPVKIGIVTTTFHPYPGGVTEHVDCTYRVLKERGHDVRIVTTSYGRGTSDVEDDVIRIGRAVQIPTNGSICPVALGLKLPARVREILARERFDVLHIHEPFMPHLCLTALGEARGPVVGTFHANHESALTYGASKLLLKRYAGKVTRRIAVSEAARETVARHFPGEYTIIPNGVDVERFSRARPFPEFADGRISLLYVGRMEPRKGPKWLFKALPRIFEEVPECHMTVVGSGPLTRYYRSFIPRSIRDRVDFRGYVSGSTLARLYASADIYCSPATGGESFGIVLLEAMAARAAIVASSIPGYEAVLDDGTTGLLARPTSPASIAAAVIRLARDEELRRRLVENASHEVTRYAWDRVTAEILEVYEAAIDEHHGRTGPARDRAATGEGATERNESAEGGSAVSGKILVR